MTFEPASDLWPRARSLPAASPLLKALRADPPVHLVGGAVRDLLLGGAPTDLDLVVEGDPVGVAASLGGKVRGHDRFGTLTVRCDGFRYDLARARRETYAHPGALPDVQPASLAEDLQRRDFTVNAAALTLTGAAAGELHTVAAALPDLRQRWLRVLHQRSFNDDPTRLLRLARYRARLSFSVEPETLSLARAALEGGALGTVSGPRIGNELRLLAREADPVAALIALHELDIDAAIEPGFGLSTPEPARAAQELLGPGGRPDRLVLALGVAGVAEDRRAPLLDRLAFEAADREAILAVAAGAAPLARALARTASPSQISAAIADGSPELVALAGALGPSEPAREWLWRLRHIGLEINGGDLLAAGVPQGPAVGLGLSAALAAKLDGRAAGRAEELAEALRAAG